MITRGRWLDDSILHALAVSPSRVLPQSACRHLIPEPSYSSYSFLSGPHDGPHDLKGNELGHIIEQVHQVLKEEDERGRRKPKPGDE